MMQCMRDLTPVDAAKRVAKERFAWPGGYALGIITADNGVLCSACVADELELIIDPDADDQWKPMTAYYADADDDGVEDDLDNYPVTYCDHCNRPISDATSQT